MATPPLDQIKYLAIVIIFLSSFYCQIKPQLSDLPGVEDCRQILAET